MKERIKRWLYLPDYTERDILVLQSAFNTILERLKSVEEEQKMYSGSIPRERGVKEHVYAIIEYLNLKPKETFTEEEVEPITTITRRHFSLTPTDITKDKQ